ncbi:mRNA-decapping enzyme subunit 2 [Elasticomyces elasticus]|nr:mRNA-decapping enzyme subunit 2 [Elasticomyces elasticus]KAK3658652.1 mRNA-decapping enzyme subunit 2 [Elasticomyces elasticus]KAK4913575.1 mRNA-decapping enzyme subunit 2 [Elasticomyces elasticus]KAK5756589.1 mRNA-decapping enzyme subunit 2 [Elasticomyces elasticus]
MSLADHLDDLTVRFLLNLPSSELSSVPRLCFQVEEAQWFYEDFIRPAAAAAGKPLPSLPLRQFCLQLFQHCPLLSGFTDAQHIAAYEEFLAYKVRVPVRGAILLDESMEKLVLVKGWKKGASWSFPRGKINKDEKDLDCAVREVYEETGYDVKEAGLFPDDEGDAKYIDVTMREQHMRLFVFRGVKEDTYFEPQTRKEISKIAWYSIRDLPGFAKRQKGAEQVSANKFYMVAPFLGPLKKWINVQRKRDEDQEARNMAQGAAFVNQDVEDEVEVKVEEPVLEEAAPVVDQSAELRKMLSLGTPSETPVSTPIPTDDGPSKSLLSLLRGPPSNNVPQTPIEQINAYPPQPETPQPHHPRHPSMGYQQQPVPQFPFSPDRLQQQQRNFSVPTPNTFGPGPAGFAHGPPPPHMHPQHLRHLQHQQHRQSMPTHPSQRPGPPPISGPPPINSLPFGMPQRQQMQPPPPHTNFLPNPQHMPQHQPPHWAHEHLLNNFPRSSDAFMLPQGPQGAISAGPAVPKAANLPMPNLNAHSMQLLNAFKSASNKQQQLAANGSESTMPAKREPNVRQAALLDLFRKPAAVSQPAQSTAKVDVPSSPIVADAVEQQPMAQQGRRSTLNEITRTLPAKLKAKAPAVGKQAAAPVGMGLPQAQRDVAPVQAKPILDHMSSHATPAQESNTIPQATLPTPHQPVERPISRGQLFDPVASKQRTQTSSQPIVPKTEQASARSQRPAPSDHAQRSPRPPRSPKPRHAAHQRQSSAAKGAENGAPAPQPTFTILARPGTGSMRADNSPALSSQQSPAISVEKKASRIFSRDASSPSVHAAQAPGVQLLRRPESVEPETVQKAAEVVEESNANGANGLDKREQLLALFGKGGMASPPPVQKTPQPVVAPTAEGRKSNLLNLFNTTSGNTTPGSAATPTPAQSMPPPPPPSAPHIQPEERPRSQTVIHHRQKTPQNLLLEMFNKPSTGKLDSPGTPISPFTLGTPAQRQAPGSLLGSLATSGPSGLSHEATANGRASTSTPSESRKGSGAGTPVETKGFLLDYLAGVVQKEGYKGAKR